MLWVKINIDGKAIILLFAISQKYGGKAVNRFAYYMSGYALKAFSGLSKATKARSRCPL
jgi:hypothetical protein